MIRYLRRRVRSWWYQERAAANRYEQMIWVPAAQFDRLMASNEPEDAPGLRRMVAEERVRREAAAVTEDDERLRRMLHQIRNDL